MRISVLWEGKTRDLHLRALIADYRRRIEHFGPIEIEELKLPARKDRGRSGMEHRLRTHPPGTYKVILDAQGRQLNSEEFARWLGGQALRGTREIIFVLGGPDGLPPALRREADMLLALSRLTFTHEWSRALLMEQIYRGFAALRGHPYPR